ncbi:MAG: class I SAM-dependent methyltransferase, partial [Nocardioidaceae bacterium]
MASGSSVAERLVGMIEIVAGEPVPVRIRAWDGSEAGPPQSPVVTIRTRRALRRMLWRTDELGLARAYVAGGLDLEGDLVETLSELSRVGEEIGRRPHLSLSAKARLVGTAIRLGIIGPAPKPPPEEIVLHGAKHSKMRDLVAVSHHYDLGNDFYRHVLGESLVYSCAYWRAPDDPSYRLDDAQRDKVDLVCRKLRLQPGMRVLDVGCGWGSFALHAAREYNVEVVGITLSHEQMELARKRVEEANLQEQVEIRLQDWRDLDDRPFDAIASIGMAEHVGRERFGEYASSLFARLMPGGRLLNHQIARYPGPEITQRTFVDASVFPDGALLPIAGVVDALEHAGFEVRDVHALREHYSRTLRA